MIAANIELDERRQFTETVLSGVSAGVIGLDADTRINLPNRSASILLDLNLEEHIGEKLEDVAPELNELLNQSKARNDRLQQAEVSIRQKDGQKTLLVRVAAEKLDGNVIGYVVTFDDVTELLSAQRKAAWADVARRIAHEIKNPLTPIQLSAERLNRKYLKEISSDKETFQKCTETIIRQVSDIGRMVDEFSSFARMPQPEIKIENMTELCRQAVFLERNRDSSVSFELELPEEDIMVPCDSRQVALVLTNVLKNSAESIQGAREEGSDEIEGKVTLRIISNDENNTVHIAISDDGRGLPADQRDRLTEPYVTTREKGTGLGLAIVKKIMEEHGGSLTLTDRAPRGAEVTLQFPKQEPGTIIEDGSTDAASSAAAT